MPLTECANRITSQSNIGKRTHDPENEYPSQHTSAPPKKQCMNTKQQIGLLNSYFHTEFFNYIFTAFGAILFIVSTNLFVRLI